VKRGVHGVGTEEGVGGRSVVRKKEGGVVVGGGDVEGRARVEEIGQEKRGEEGRKQKKWVVGGVTVYG